MVKGLPFIALLLLLSPLAHADPSFRQQGQIMHSVLGDYGRCYTLSSGYVGPDKNPTEKLAKVILSKSRALIDFAVKHKDPKTLQTLKFMNKDMLTGYMFATFDEIPQNVSERRVELLTTLGNLKAVDQVLWKEMGCNAIYSTL